MARKAQRRKRPLTNPAGQPWDIIDELTANVGKIRSKGSARPGEEGYYGELYRSANRGAGRQVFSPRGQSPDSAVDALRRSGGIRQDASVDDLWEAIERASGVRREGRRYDNPERQAERFSAMLGKREKAKCKKLIPAARLKVGQTFTLDGAPFRVSSIDPDTFDIDVIDGERFGHQTIPDGALIPADKVCKPAKAKKAVHRRPSSPSTSSDLRYLIRRRKPARKRPVNFVGLRVGSKIRVLKVMGSALRTVGTFTTQALKRWAARTGVKLGK